MTPVIQTYFSRLRQIGNDELLSRFDGHIHDRLSKMPDDEKERKIRARLATLGDRLACYEGELNEAGTRNLILPGHNHGFWSVRMGGSEFNEIVGKFAADFVVSQQNSLCVQKVLDLKKCFFTQSAQVQRAEFLLACNSRRYAHDENHYDDTHGGSRIFMANGFHRFVAYGLWVNENGFKPLVVHYADVPEAER